MKLPKEMKRYCPSCKKHTLHKVKEIKNRGKNKAHPLSKYSTVRLAMRGIGVGIGRGNAGRYSRGALNSWKRYNKKHSKKIDMRYTCNECGKTHTPSGNAIRTKKLVLQ